MVEMVCGMRKYINGENEEINTNINFVLMQLCVTKTTNL